MADRGVRVEVRRGHAAVVIRRGTSIDAPPTFDSSSASWKEKGCAARPFGITTPRGDPARISDAQRMATRVSLRSGAGFTGRYVAMNAAATLVAGFGLFENSPAVIIGAMLIAILFGPIVGIALGLSTHRGGRVGTTNRNRDFARA